MEPIRRWMVTGKESCDVVASPLFAGLFKKMNSNYPELAALVPEISKVRVAVATPKSIATPAEQREESLQAFRKATNKSAAAEEALRNHKKLEAARKNLEELQSSSPKWSGGHETLDAACSRSGPG